MKKPILILALLVSASAVADEVRGKCPSSISNTFESVPSGWTGAKYSGSFVSVETATYSTSNDGVLCYYTLKGAGGESHIYKEFSGYTCSVIKSSGAYVCKK